MILNKYGTNISVPNFIKQALLNIKGQIGPNSPDSHQYIDHPDKISVKISEN
jgi:hypothetical protein